MFANVENLEVLKINFNQLKVDYEKDKIDPQVARIEAQTIIRNLLKIKEDKNLTSEIQNEIASLLRKTNDLLYTIINDIEMRNTINNV